jgi:hypothetical protein
MFNSIINNTIQIRKPHLIPVNNHSLDAVIQLITNCRDLSIDLSIGVQYAKFDISLWLNDFLVNNYSKIKYVTALTRFTLEYIENDRIYSKFIDCVTIQFDSDDELQNFFDDNDGKTLVIYTIVKYIDLKTLKVFYTMRYVDITERDEEREMKINKIFQ